MPVEAALIKPIVDAIVAMFKGGKTSINKVKAQKEIQAALAELWKVDPDIEMVEAAIRGAEIAGLIDADVQRAKNRLARVAKTAPAKKPSAKKAAPAKKAPKRAPMKPAKKAARGR